MKVRNEICHSPFLLITFTSTMFRTIIIFILSNICASTFAQIERGALIFDAIPKEVLQLTHDGKINLIKTRSIADFITNNTIQSYKKHKLGKRKKALIRHVRMLNEQLEYNYFSEQKLSSEDYEMLFEMLLIQASLIDDAKNPSGQTPGFFKKANMFLTSRKNIRIKVDKAHTKLEGKNSPYWNSVENRELMLSRFDDLAKLKKIKPKKELVVLYKSLSYTGSAPKIRTLDTDYDNEWSLKWGDEVHADVVGSRIFSALGYDTDHPYFYGQDRLILVFEDGASIQNVAQLTDSLKRIYNFNLKPFTSKTGLVDSAMIQKNKALIPYWGMEYACFVKCAVEARPDRVKRLGSFCPNQFNNPKRMELRASLLAHIWIGNWDTREQNTLLTNLHKGNREYQISAVFSDLGTSMGVQINVIPNDFKAGLVNAFEWDVATRKNGKIYFKHSLNEILQPFKEATFADLYWMAEKIALFDEKMLRAIIKESGWAKPVAELYFHKMASRRASILSAFEISDPNPIAFDRCLNVSVKGREVIKNGVLIEDFEREKNPESLFHSKGRFRNYGN
jgi:hypothetical protein